MTLYHSLVLGLLQGLTEFLPISSSGHLVLMQTYMGLQLESSVLQHFDIVLHGGSLIAIFLYFWKTWIKILRHPFSSNGTGGPPLLFALIIASVPLGIVGFLSADWIQSNTHTPLFVAFGFIFTGAFLITSGWFESRFAAKESLGWKQIIGSGIGQALGVLPGFSRSGMTLASGRLMGLTAFKATEFAFMLGAPALGGALLYTLGNGREALAQIGGVYLLIGFVMSLISSLSVIYFFIHTIRKYGVWMWSAYLFVAAVLIIGDEMLPLVREIPNIGELLDMRVVAGTLFIALLLGAAPFTSFFTPSFAIMVSLGTLLHDQPANIAACIPIATIALIIGNLLGYIPTRQARLKIRWKEATEQKLTKLQHFFKKWGIPIVFFGNWYGPVRSLTSIAAGIGNMRPAQFILTITFSSFLWASLVLIISAMVAGGVLS